MFKLLITSLLFVSFTKAVYLPVNTCENIQQTQLDILQSLKTLIADLQPLISSNIVDNSGSSGGSSDGSSGGSSDGSSGDSSDGSSGDSSGSVDNGSSGDNSGSVDNGSTEGDNSVRNVEIQENYYDGSKCNTGGIFSENQYGAKICQYPGTTCDLVKYFVYEDGDRGFEKCCESNDDCDYDPIKNYCAPNLNTCSDGSFFGCSTKGGPIFESCL